MPEYTFNGDFQITTDCADLEEITKSLNETARIFTDIVKWRTQKNGYMYFTSEIGIDLPINELGVEANIKEPEIEEEEENAPEEEA